MREVLLFALICFSIISAVTTEPSSQSPSDQSSSESISSSQSPSSTETDDHLQTVSAENVESIPHPADEAKEEAENEETRRANIFYDMAMNVLNSSKPNKLKAYHLLVESAKLNNVKAQELVAQAYLFGEYLPLDIPGAIQYLKKLAYQGRSLSQMVSIYHEMTV